MGSVSMLNCKHKHVIYDVHGAVFFSINKNGRKFMSSIARRHPLDTRATPQNYFIGYKKKRSSWTLGIWFGMRFSYIKYFYCTNIAHRADYWCFFWCIHYTRNFSKNRVRASVKKKEVEHSYPKYLRNNDHNLYLMFTFVIIISTCDYFRRWFHLYSRHFGNS